MGLNEAEMRDVRRLIGRVMDYPRVYEPLIEPVKPGLVAVYCPNASCPEVVRTGRRQVVAKVTLGALVEAQCRKCRQLVTARGVAA